MGALPPALADRLGRRLGDLAFAALPRRRRLALTNLAAALPEVTGAERWRLARRSFQHLGLVAVESCVLVSQPPATVPTGLTMDGLEHLHEAVRRYGRALILTGHIGNWEMLGAAHGMTGSRLSIVVRPLDLPWLDAMARRLRERGGVEIIDKRAALRPVMRGLAAGHLVGILLDQNASRREGVFVPFFGRLASTSRGLAVLAIRTKVPVLPVFARRRSPGHHHVQVFPPVAAPGTGGGAGTEEVVEALTRRYTTIIEEAIRQAPDQWLWMHDRWRTRPAYPAR